MFEPNFLYNILTFYRPADTCVALHVSGIQYFPFWEAHQSVLIECNMKNTVIDYFIYSKTIHCFNLYFILVFSTEYLRKLPP